MIRIVNDRVDLPGLMADAREEKRVYAWFREREPDSRVGHSILIFNVE